MPFELRPNGSVSVIFHVNIWSSHGSVLAVTTFCTLRQWGRFEMRLCPLSHAGDAAEAAELSEECLSQHVLTLADGSGPYHFVKVPSVKRCAAL